MGQLGFSDLDERYRSLDAKKDPLVFLNEVVPWEDFRARLSAVWRKPDEERKNAAGRKPWDEIVIFQTLVLQALEFVARIGRLACGDGWRRRTTPSVTLDPRCRSKPMLLAATISPNSGAG